MPIIQIIFPTWILDMLQAIFGSFLDVSWAALLTEPETIVLIMMMKTWYFWWRLNHGFGCNTHKKMKRDDAADTPYTILSSWIAALDARERRELVVSSLVSIVVNDDDHLHHNADWIDSYLWILPTASHKKPPSMLSLSSPEIAGIQCVTVEMSN